MQLVRGIKPFESTQSLFPLSSGAFRNARFSVVRLVFAIALALALQMPFPLGLRHLLDCYEPKAERRFYSPLILIA